MSEDEATRQLPAITEATSSLGAMFEPEPVRADPTSAAFREAQWFSDPSGRHQLRYWDGRQWTDHVSNGGVGGTDPVSGH